MSRQNFVVLLQRIVLFLLVFLYSVCAEAQPRFIASGNTFSISGGFTKEMRKEISKSIKENGTGAIHFELTEISLKDFEQICSLYPNMESLVLKNGFADCSPVKKLKNLKKFQGKNILAEDFSCFSGLKELEYLDLTANNMGPELSWMSNMKKLRYIYISSKKLRTINGIPKTLSAKTVILSDCPAENLSVLAEALPNVQYLGLVNMNLPDLTPLSNLAELKKINFSYSRVRDFSPLSHCPKLEELTYYEVRDCDFNSLSELKELRILNGGRTTLKDLKWIEKLSLLKEFNIFSEYVHDYSPLKNTSLEYLQIGNMHSTGNLSDLGGITSLTHLILSDLEGAENSKALSGLHKLEEIRISGYNLRGKEPFDLSAAQGWKKVKKLYLNKGVFIHPEQIAAMSSLEEISLSQVKSDTGTLDISFIEKLQNLKELSIEECSISKFDTVLTCPQLQQITLDRVKGIPDLGILKKMPQLKSLTINRELLSEEIKELSKKINIQFF